jgi:hypothetical protein
VPTQAKSRARTPFRQALDLPPPFRLVRLREMGDAFAHAVEIAAEEGAGTLVHIGRFDVSEFAVVLEPDEPLRLARRAFYAGMAALGDALAAHAPPERPLGIDWPDAVRVDGGLVGGGRLAWPEGADEAEPPDWLVFGAMIRIVAMGEREPGLFPLTTALEAEGFEGIDSAGLVEGFARHLMLMLDSWREEGFGAVARQYLARAPAGRDVRRRIEENGDLVVMRAGRGERLSLAEALAYPSWLDPKTGRLRR